MRIGIIGAGNAGNTSGNRLTQRGSRVVFNVDNPDGDKVKILLASV
jgi:predicted dinucleotide-binding enzyme